MSIGLSNVKLSASNSHSEYTQRVKRARPSIAEDAIFIPKPKKRVSFEAVNPVKGGAGAGSGSSNRGEKIPLPGSSSNSGEVQLLGEGVNNNSGNLDKADVSELSNEIPSLGENGISAISVLPSLSKVSASIRTALISAPVLKAGDSG